VPSIPTPRRELIAAGATSHALDSELRSGRSVAPFRGVHVDAAHAGSWLARVRAATATQAATAVVAMQTAAVLLGLRWLPAEWSALDAQVHFAVRPDDKRRDRPGIKLHRRTLAAADIVLVQGVACLSVARTLVELARDSRLPELLVVQIIDGALRDKRITKVELFACLAPLTGERGVVRARRLVERAREGIDSPQETAMRLMLEDGGITDLEVGVEICEDDDGDVLARGDLCIRLLLIWGEYDGFGPHSQRPTFRSDRRGDRWLHRRGWHVMRFTDEDLRRPRETCREWLAAVADAPARIRALDPRRSPEIAAAWQGLGFS
jgi:hypothetical protein